MTSISATPTVKVVIGDTTHVLSMLEVQKLIKELQKIADTTKQEAAPTFHPQHITNKPRYTNSWWPNVWMSSSPFNSKTND